MISAAKVRISGAGFPAPLFDLIPEHEIKLPCAINCIVLISDKDRFSHISGGKKNHGTKKDCCTDGQH